MTESLDHAAASDTAANGETVTDEASPSPVINLPAVMAPALGATGATEETIEAGAGYQSAAAAGAAAARGRSKRFAMLAASVAFAAGFGSFIGSVSGSGLARFIYPAPPPPASGVENTMAAMREIKLELAEITALKAGLDNAARSAANQYAKIADRLDHLEQRGSSAPETTALLPAAAPAPESAKLNDRVLQDWIVHDVQNGRALVESRYGGLFDVSAGSVLPGIGRVDMIKRQDGHWVVLTARGTITSAR